MDSIRINTVVIFRGNLQLLQVVQREKGLIAKLLDVTVGESQLFQRYEIEERFARNLSDVVVSQIATKEYKFIINQCATLVTSPLLTIGITIHHSIRGRQNSGRVVQHYCS